MLLFNRERSDKEQEEFYLNTSHVIVQLASREISIPEKRDLNTSHVIVQQC